MALPARSQLVLVALILVVVIAVAAVFAARFEPRGLPASTATPLPAVRAPTAPPAVPTPLPTVTSSPSPTVLLPVSIAAQTASATPVGFTASATAGALAEPDPAAFLSAVEAITVPYRDLAALAERVKGAAVQTPAPAAKDRSEGSKDQFWVTNTSSAQHFSVTATLRFASLHLYMYVADDVTSISNDALRASAEVFEGKIYPTTRRYFGTAWGPGLDGDEHISILHVQNLGAAGYFSSADEESTIGNVYSNGRHMLYMNAASERPGTTSYDSTLAHEFQHAVHFFEDRNEDTWVNEGASVLSQKLNGYIDSPLAYLDAFRRNPGVQLDTWGDEPSRSSHYGAAFAFMDYWHERFGDQALSWLIADPRHGAAGFEATLARLGSNERFDDVFGDWLTTNLLDDASIAGGRYAYKDLDLRLLANATVASAPGIATASARQYSGYYVQFSLPQSTGTVYFTGTATTTLTANQARSGSYQWWSNRGDLMDTTLTRSFDLSALSAATLTFWTWYDIEQDWDYAYLLVSSDGGKSWASLPTQRTTSSNPSGNNLGNGYTGISGGGQQPAWASDRADLTPYAGKQIMVRFEYVTDDALAKAGFCIDDVGIPELGFADDAETQDGWTADGFVRSSNTIPQSYVVRLITFGAQTQVRSLPVDARGHAQTSISGAARAVLAIAGVAPITSEQTQFSYEIQAGGR